MVLGGAAGTHPTTEGSVPRHVGTTKSKASASRKERFAPLGSELRA